MIPILQACLSAVLIRKRVCPKCKRSQIVAGAKSGMTVRCKHCGAQIPPPR